MLQQGGASHCSAGGRLQCTTLSSASALVKQQGRHSTHHSSSNSKSWQGHSTGPNACQQQAQQHSSRGLHSHAQQGSRQARKQSSSSEQATTTRSQQCRMPAKISYQQSVRIRATANAADVAIGGPPCITLGEPCEFSTHMLYCALLSHTLRMPVRLQSPLRFDAIAGGRTTGHY